MAGSSLRGVDSLGRQAACLGLRLQGLPQRWVAHGRLPVAERVRPCIQAHVRGGTQALGEAGREIAQQQPVVAIIRSLVCLSCGAAWRGDR